MGETIEREAETMLEALCRVNGQQGGTIHQFVAGSHWQDVQAMRDAYKDFVRLGLQFNSREAFDKLAKPYHIRMVW